MQTKILLLILAFSFFIIPAFSQTETETKTEALLSVRLSNASYEQGDTVVITGNVKTIITDTPVTISVFYKGNLIQIAQLDVAQDGTFTHVVVAEGPQWLNEGDYTVRAQYGEGNVAEAVFEFFKKQSLIGTTSIFEVDAGSSGTFDIEYTIRGGTVTDMVVDSEIFAIIVRIDPLDDGVITLDLPRASIDAKKTDGGDDIFIILIDGVEVPYQETKPTSNARVLTIEFEEGDSDIEIIGTFVIPEFATITFLILAISIISVIIFSSKINIKKI